MKFHTIALPITIVLVAAGCSKEAPFVPTLPDPVPATTFGFTSTNEVVSSEDIHPANKTSTVAADFNLDGLQDLAVVDAGSNGEDQVSIYIQKPAQNVSSPQKQVTLYYKGGSITRNKEGKITGIMSKRASEHTDLLVLLTHTNAPNELIHYRNDGRTFNVVALHGKVRDANGTLDMIDSSSEKLVQ